MFPFFTDIRLHLLVRTHQRQPQHILAKSHVVHQAFDTRWVSISEDELVHAQHGVMQSEGFVGAQSIISSHPISRRPCSARIRSI